MDDFKDVGTQTQRMDTSGQEFKDFQLLIKAKSQNATLEEKIMIRMAGLKFRMEDYLASETKEILPVGCFLKTGAHETQHQKKIFCKVY